MGKRHTEHAMSTHHDLVYQIVYSLRLESQKASLLRRLDSFAAWAMIVLVVSVAIGASPVLAGIAMAMVSAFHASSHSGAEAVAATASAGRWQLLYLQAPDMSAEELALAVRNIEKLDTPAIASLCLAAQRAAAMQMELDVEQLPRLTRWQTTLSLLSGV